MPTKCKYLFQNRKSIGKVNDDTPRETGALDVMWHTWGDCAPSLKCRSCRILRCRKVSTSICITSRTNIEKHAFRRSSCFPNASSVLIKRRASPTLLDQSRAACIEAVLPSACHTATLHESALTEPVTNVIHFPLQLSSWAQTCLPRVVTLDLTLKPRLTATKNICIPVT